MTVMKAIAPTTDDATIIVVLSA